ncbi:NAD(P)-binding protein [Polyplosphaeria fusca]|uniref:NAD(P)-binding protein n=1 Tax=Polyplosphaeria fusca TaxID=682080 RepID=A0A9P4QT83_9PLEO|nr:NAD(P)-binding protein [Polyplosphaeria fusca]
MSATSGPEVKYALITGCTPGGIGHFLALEFADDGFHVLATVRDPAKYEPAPHPNMTYLPLELTEPASIQSLLKRVTSLTGGKLDILYNNAGRNYTMPALDLEPAEVTDLFAANVFSVMQLCQAFAPLLITAKGTIVQTGSVAAVMPYAWGSAYCASKAALHAYSNTLRVELAPLGVRVVNIITGGVKSNLARVPRSLPENSYYLPLEDEYQKRLVHAQTLGSDTRAYARRCVRAVVARDGWAGGWLGKQRWVWEGSLSWAVWFATTWLPHAVLDWYFTWRFGLGRMRGVVQGKKEH